MSFTAEFDFSTPSDYNYDPSRVDISGGAAHLRPDFVLDPRPLAFVVDLAHCTNDPLRVENFVNGIRQKVGLVSGGLFYANFLTDFVPFYLQIPYQESGTAVVTPAEGVDLQDPTASAIYNFGTDFVDIPYGTPIGVYQTGCVRFDFKSTIAAGGDYIIRFFDLTQHQSSLNDGIELYYNYGTSQIHLLIKDHVGSTIYDQDLGSWTPSTGTTHNFELNFDFDTGGVVRLFVDGSIFGPVIHAEMLANAAINKLTIGGKRSGTTITGGFGYIKEFAIYDKVQHTDSFFPVNPFVDFEFPYAAAQVGFTSGFAIPFETVDVIAGVNTVTIVDSGADVRYVIEISGDKYWWNSSAWVASNGTYSQANSATEVTANALSIYIAGYSHPTFGVIVLFPDATTTPNSVTSIAATYTPIGYAMSDPSVFEKVSIMVKEKFSNIAEQSTVVGSDAIKHVLLLNSSDWVWWNGSAWVASNGTYAQSNTTAEIVAHIATFPSTGTTARIKSFLHSADGLTTPILSDLLLTYNFTGDPDVIESCIVWGYIEDESGAPIANAQVKINLSPILVQYKTATTIVNRSKTVVTNANGYWEAAVIETAHMVGAGIHYVFNISGQVFRRTVPAAPSASFSSLPVFG